nr:hypothetical protein [Tanacetum cinerariifolium]
TVEDKILVPKPPNNCARCTRYGYWFDGPHCQGWALLRQELEENLVTYSPDFQNTSEPSNASTNVVNAPREPYVVKQDNGSFVDEIIFDLNRAPDSPNQFHCFHCKDVLKDGEACTRCTCATCGSGLIKGLCYICRHNQNSLNDSPRISETSSQSPPNINHCCYECGDSLDGIFCKRCTSKSCGKDAHTGYNFPSKVSVTLSRNLAIIKQSMSSHNHCRFFIRHSILKLKVHSLWTQLLPMSMNLLKFLTHLHNLIYILVNFAGAMLNMVTTVLLLAWDRVSEIKDAFDKKQYKQEDVQELFLKLLDDLQNIHEELAEFINSPSWNHPAVYDDDDDDVDYTIAITPVLSTEEPDNSLSMGDEHLDTILATESDEGIKSSVENLVPSPSEFKGIPDTLCDVH